MGNVWNSNSNWKSNSRRRAALNRQLAALFCFGFALLQLSVASTADAVPGAQSPALRDGSVGRQSGRRLEVQSGNNVLLPHLHSQIPMSERMRSTIVKDRRKEHAIHARIAGGGDRLGSTLTNLDAVSLPVSLPDPNFLAYVTRLKIGTPPREFWAVPDTGSDLVWVQCDPCVECLSKPVFQTNTSTSYKPISCTNSFCLYLHALGLPTSCTATNVCNYNYTYGSGNTAGELSSEVLTLSSQNGGVEEFPGFVFGCAHESAAVLQYPILGLSRGALSLVSQLGPKVGLSGFSFCFPTYFQNKTTEMVVGINGTEDLRYTPLVPSVYYYRANVTGISVNGVLLNISTGAFNFLPDGSGGVIIDTGTSLTILQPKIYSPLRTAVESKISYRPVNGSREGLDLCYDVTTVNATTSLDQLDLPSITFHFQNLDLHLPVSNTFLYFQGADGITTLACLAIIQSQFGLSIFGNYQMQNHYFFFDPLNDRLGIKSEIC